MRSRRSIRLKKFDYKTPGAYFVTICADQRRYIFEDPTLNSILNKTWRQVPELFPGARPDVFVVMPNHVHFVIWLSPVVAPLAGAKEPTIKQPVSLDAIVGGFKSIVATRWAQWLKENPQPIKGPVWQKNYYERVVRNEDELTRVREYVVGNPLKWGNDPYNRDRIIEPEYENAWAWLEGSSG